MATQKQYEMAMERKHKHERMASKLYELAQDMDFGDYANDREWIEMLLTDGIAFLRSLATEPFNNETLKILYYVLEAIANETQSHEEL